MIKNYFKIAWRNLKKNKMYSFINIGGLAVGMAVAMLIGLWVWDELSFDKYHKNYDRIGQVWQFVKFDVEKASYNSVPVPLAEEFRTKYPDFELASVTTYNRTTVLGTDDKKISRTGMYTEPQFPEMMTVKMLSGTRNGLKDMNSILLSESLAKVLFGKDDPLNKIVRMDNKTDVKVTGVYEDFPGNSSFKDVYFLSPWLLFTSFNSYAKNASTQWDENSFQLFVQLKEDADFAKVSSAIKDLRMKRDDPPAYKPEFFVHPMSRWHLHGDFKDGQNTGGLIQLVKMFGMAGIFVLLLACINFMNLSTARSEKRAKEVGIRKTIGSVRSQLIYQFFSESLLVVFIALLFCFALVQISLPLFNDIAGKSMTIPWANLNFWLMAIGFCLITGLIAGSYPALYLSSFRPTKVLKGTFKAGRFAALPRKALVVFQFTVSVALMIGTIIVFRQINYAKDRPVGYDSDGLIEVNMTTPDLYKNYEALQTELLNSGYVRNICQSSGSVTADYGGTTDIGWKGKTGNTRPLFISNKVSYEYGNTIGWKILQGRDFSRSFSTDTAAVILNTSAIQTMGFKNPLEEAIRISGKNYQVIGVVNDMIKFSPYDQVKPSIFTLDKNGVSVITIKIAQQAGISTALNKIENLFKKNNPAAPFEYKFVDEEYAAKFSNEVRIGKLAGFFAILAIFISCLGLFGLASFVAEQRTKEIGVRKVLGATILSVWRLLSKDFVLLVFISLLIASPLAYYFMHGWLENYRYRINISWWIFALAGVIAFLLTLIMVSFQAIKAAIANPVKSLRAE
ncbi:ABC transporter permease [Terrimonas pollutisoli]|uniref:ABC transporter permease n=1 Tax=Terrimonas pollutisoli TaxID=3034147 RepID=UPI0023EACF6C|nr:ABC transporter permease [Terrimonas sp. H1YJ31]